MKEQKQPVQTRQPKQTAGAQRGLGRDKVRYTLSSVFPEVSWGGVVDEEFVPPGVTMPPVPAWVRRRAWDCHFTAEEALTLKAYLEQTYGRPVKVERKEWELCAREQPLRDGPYVLPSYLGWVVLPEVLAVPVRGLFGVKEERLAPGEVWPKPGRPPLVSLVPTGWEEEPQGA